MSSLKALDISELCNHKLIYGKLLETEDYGLDNICILKEDFKFKDRETLDGIDFQFYVGEQADNIACEAQQLEINERVKALHFIGFTYWGDTCEYFRLVYEDGTVEYMNIAFVDWSHDIQNDVETSFLMKAGSVAKVGICISSGKMIHLIYFHHYTYRACSHKKLRKIIFPDNMFIHIFAVTIEKDVTFSPHNN